MKDNIERKQPLELYVHIPFCEKKCDYCDFLSMPASLNEKKLYYEALLKEINEKKGLAEEYQIVSIFFGGGTPTSIPSEWLVNILKTILEVFEVEDTSEIEITTEANPGTLTRQKLEDYYKAGFNRLSIGLQSTDNKELKCLGRIHTYEQFLENYKVAREVGFHNINVDLMSALPGQTVLSYEKTLQEVLSLRPTHISAYSLIIEEETPFYSRYGEKGAQVRELPGEDNDRAMYHLTKKLLGEHGYHRYEISNYSLDGMECRHNVGYWTGVEYLGLGLGASSYIKEMRYHNETDLATYVHMIETNTDMKREVHQVTIGEQMEEFMFLGLRLVRGVSKKQFMERFHKTMDEVYGDVLARLERKQLITMNAEDNMVALTEEGIDVSNYVMAQFLLEE